MALSNKTTYVIGAIIAALLISVTFFAMNNTNTQSNPTVVMSTNMGDITLELFANESPVTAGNFLKLAQEGFYNGTRFHRVIGGFMIQGGDPLSKDEAMKDRWGTGGPGYTIEDEFVVGLSNARGAIAMANSGPQSGGSQFFINVADNTPLDWDKEPLTSKHPVFGKVIAGMEVVDAISKVDTVGSPTDRPMEDVVVSSVTIAATQAEAAE